MRLVLSASLLSFYYDVIILTIVFRCDRLKLRVFKIVTEYDIENVVLSINNCKKNSYLLKDFINEYEATFNGHIKVK